jgi:uncharacterized protein YjbJ (UPF0337 family)
VASSGRDPGVAFQASDVPTTYSALLKVENFSLNRKETIVINQETLQGNWTEMRGKIREKWSQLTDNDLGEFQGNVDQLVGRIQQRTGAARSSIEDFLGEISANASTMMGRLGSAVHESAHNIQHAAGQVQHAVADSAANAEDFVRNRPGQAVAIAFGVGVVAGLGIAICMQRPQQTPYQRAMSTSEQYGRQLLNAIANALPENLASHIRA